MKDISMIPREQLGKGSSIKLEIMDSEEDIYHDMAREMFDEISKNNKSGKKTAFICPVGPIGQYKKFARLVNIYRLNLKNVYIFNMDEYLDENKKYISYDSPLCFRAFMDRELYSRIDDSLNIPEQNRFFPEPGNENLIWEKISQLGGIDISFGGIGINGHIAFNEPPEPGENITDEQFKNLKTRVLKLSRETRTINAAMAAGGNIDSIPPWCITIGMKEILSAKKIRFYMNRFWQRGIVRKILHGPVTSKVPASFFNEHPDAKLGIVSQVSIPPLGKLV